MHTLQREGREGEGREGRGGDLQLKTVDGMHTHKFKHSFALAYNPSTAHRHTQHTCLYEVSGCSLA